LSIVVWHDAHAIIDQHSIDEALQRHRPFVIQTVGYVLRSDEVGVLVAGEWLPSDGEDPEAFRNITFIPRGMVVTETAQPRPRKKAIVAAPQP
jgi:hypothetical protein